MCMRDNFSVQVKEILSFASEEALRLGDRTLDTEHLLMGLIRQGDNHALRILEKADIDLQKVWKEAETISLEESGGKTKMDLRLPLSRQAEKVINRSQREARATQSPMVKAEHLLLSLLKHKRNKGARILSQFNINYEAFLLNIAH
jgi:ATP-dependent Clp protease ATP-binding subunit ClpC